MKTILFLFLMFALTGSSLQAQDTIAIDTTIEFQSITGWGHGGGILGHCGGAFTMLDSAVANPINYQVLDYLVDDLGLTGSRTWEVGPRIDGTGMDNGDCDSIDWTKFQPQSLPRGLSNYLVYFKNRVIANGYQPNFYSSPGYPTHATDQKPWIMFHPGERAQQIWASALYMKDSLGIDINYDVIYNEPSGNVTATVLADDVKALGPRLIAHGLNTRSQYAEAVAPQTDWNFITPVQNDSELWSYVGRLSYHNYGTADPYRSLIYNFGLSKGITTAQTEMASPTFDELYSDLTIANVSYWEVAYAAPNTLVPDTGLTSFTPSATYFRMRQVLHYVKPGAVRVEALSSDTLLHILSFKRNGALTIIIDNTSATAQNVFLSGIPAGIYGLCKSAPGAAAFQELGLRTVTTGDTISIPVAQGSAVTTLYPYAGANQPPTIMTFKTVPGYLVAPATAVTVSVTANDAELQPLTYQWSTVSFPAGATPVLAAPTASTTTVTGLSMAGTYVFTIDVNDGISTSSKQVYVVEYSTTPPPVLGSSGFRIAAPYGLVFGNPGDTTHANIELPTSTVILQTGIADLAGSNFSGQGTWTLISQPGGASAAVSATTYIFVSLRATVTNMIMAGDYVFQINVINPGHPDLTAQIICTVHPASSPPVINSIISFPAAITLPASTTLLTAITSDPDLDLLRHWWAIVSTPVGAYPQFDNQCKPVTGVSGLTVPGIYTFQLRAFDDLHMTTQNISVQVNAATGIEDVSDTNDGIIVYPNPITDDLNIKTFNNESTEIILFDITGRNLLQKKFTNTTTLNTEQLAQGIYTYEVKNKSGVIKNGKVVKN
ncbi:MAG: T9SS type A sorting domain-containing protein [Bacteroidota bacterium]